MEFNAFWIKFSILFLGMLVWIWKYSGNLGFFYKLVFSGGAAFAIWIALQGKSLKGFSGRR